MTFGGKTPNKAEAARRDACKAGRVRTVAFDWCRVAISSSDACWEWQGSRNKWGYGDCHWNGRRANASRAAYESVHGFVSAGHVVCHRCDNPACCNPAHLWADTQANNLADCRLKGRAAGTFGCGNENPRHRAKLSTEMVEEAKRLYSDGVTQTAIGRQMGVHSSVISRAVRGETWGASK